MCGIFGIIYKDYNKTVELNELKSSADLIRYRGPDDEGYYIKNNVGMGFRRLSIIDLKSGHQPLSNSDNTLWITFNGEIYNYLSLKNLLINNGFKFKTRSDTEVILFLYELYQEDCVQYLEGMFSFVIWDERKKRIFGARDRFGIKPLYYYDDHEKFIWSSEIKSILQINDTNVSLRSQSVDEYFTYGYISGEDTIYNEIKKIAPGSMFYFNNFNFNKSKYWKFEFHPDASKSEAEWIDELDKAFRKSVKRHMISDVPIGAFLSGGIDSSAVVAFMSQISANPIKTFTIGFKDHEFSESDYAKIMAKKYNTEHHELIVEPESIDLLPKLISIYDEPFADTSIIPTYHVSKFASQFVKVVLSGDGGDEFFAGYSLYRKFRTIIKSPFYNRFMADFFWKPLHGVLPDYMYGKGLSYYFSRKTLPMNLYCNIFKDYERNGLYNSKIRANVDIDSTICKRRKLIANGRYPTDLDEMQAFDILTYLPEDILFKVDRASMASSLETRVPIIDHIFLETVSRIPADLKLNGTEQKYIFRKMLANYLPNEILNRKKHGFQLPISNWFKKDFKFYLYDTLLDKRNEVYNYINFKEVKTIFKNNSRSQRDFSHKLWSILVFNEWLKQNNKWLKS